MGATEEIDSSRYDGGKIEDSFSISTYNSDVKVLYRINRREVVLRGVQSSLIFE